MATILLVIIYVAAISLGLPDSMLGVTWPVSHIELGAQESLAGVFSAAISLFTVVSSLFSSKLTTKFGTERVIAFSCALTAVGLFGCVFINNAYLFFLTAVPMGLGAGAIDSAMNDYVAKNYKALQMNWLHCFWGVGALISPVIVSALLRSLGNWRYGYLTIGAIQAVLSVLLFATFPIWKKQKAALETAITDTLTSNNAPITQEKTISMRQAFAKRGVIFSVISFLVYCGMEMLIPIWGSTYFVNAKGLDAATAALWVSAYYGGMALGRFLSGFISLKVRDITLIRCGAAGIIVGAIIMLTLPGVGALIGSLIIGLGCAPVYPAMMHLTPIRYGREYSSQVIGAQTAATYTGLLTIPPIVGFTATRTTFDVLPYFILGLIAVYFVLNEIATRLTQPSLVKNK